MLLTESFDSLAHSAGAARRLQAQLKDLLTTRDSTVLHLRWCGVGTDVKKPARLNWQVCRWY